MFFFDSLAADVCVLPVQRQPRVVVHHVRLILILLHYTISY